MKKIIIVNNNMRVGGVQKSLCNLLWELDKREEYEVTLLLFSPVGDYMDDIPPSVKCISTKSLFRYLGTSQGEMKGIDRFKRGFLAGVCRTFGMASAMRLILSSQKRLSESYDCAVAFLHNGGKKAFLGGAQDFVLKRINAKKKVAFLHCDYDKCGANHSHNNKLIAEFDAIAACSDGCRAVFEKALPHLEHKCVTVRNCNNIEKIKALSEQDAVEYSRDFINIITVSRLSAAKGVDRAIEAVASAVAKGVAVKLHIVGGGSMAAELLQLAKDRGIGEHVVFYGEQANPYRFMKNADLFLLTSHHEAAPMVIDEAYILGVPTLTVRTTSSDEMVSARGCGWVCENDQELLNKMLLDVLANPYILCNEKEKLKKRVVNNDLAIEQFLLVVN